MYRKKYYSSIFIALAFFSAIATTYERVEVFNKAELNNLSCGWPMRYLSSGFSENPLDPPYPWKEKCASLIFSEWGNALDIQWVFFISNVAFFYLLWFVIFYGGRKAIRKIRTKDESFKNNSV